MIEKETLRGILSQRNGELFQAFTKTEQKVKKEILDHLSQDGFTSHGASHSANVERKIDELVPTPVKESLTSIEIYLLLSAVYLHDIGMASRDFSGQSIAEIRSTHHVRSRSTIIEKYLDLYLEESIAFRIADICLAHGLHSLDEFEDMDYIDGYGDIRLKFIMALLRIGDLLDWSKSRAPIITSDLLKIGGDSYKYWIQHSFVDSIRCDNVKYQIDINGIPKGRWSKSLLVEIQTWAQNEIEIVSNILAQNQMPYAKVNLKFQKYKYQEYSPDRVGKNPFQFLLSYSDDTRDLYFGREQELHKFIQDLFSHNYLFLLGESGIGKTSFVKAGVMPVLEELSMKFLYQAFEKLPDSIPMTSA